jgi:glycosyltransferase involved in cell wall biosynthesis
MANNKPLNRHSGSEPRPIKIVRIISRLNIGGPASHAVLLTAGLNDARMRSILVTGTVGSKEGDMQYIARQYGVNPIVIPELGREISWREDLIALWKLFRLLTRERPDIVHTHTPKARTLGGIAALLARVPIRIHTFHGHYFYGYFGPRKTRVFLWIERMLARFATKLVAISDAQLLDLSDRYRISAREKFTVVPLGVDLSILLNVRRAAEGNSASGPGREVRIGFVSRLVPVKNPQMALRVFTRLVRRPACETPPRLVFVGDGELKAALQAEAAQLGVRDHVSFAGWQSNIGEWYARLDVVALTSLNEGTPLALIEAMASELPFVATRVGGVPDLVCGPEEVVRRGDGRPLFSLFANGVLVGLGDEEGFDAALWFLLSDRARMRRMGQAGREFARDRFSKERLVRDIQALYWECLSGRADLARCPGQPVEPAEREFTQSAENAPLGRAGMNSNT